MFFFFFCTRRACARELEAQADSISLASLVYVPINPVVPPPLEAHGLVCLLGASCSVTDRLVCLVEPTYCWRCVMLLAGRFRLFIMFYLCFGRFHHVAVFWRLLKIALEMDLLFVHRFKNTLEGVKSMGSMNQGIAARSLSHSVDRNTGALTPHPPGVGRLNLLNKVCAPLFVVA